MNNLQIPVATISGKLLPYVCQLPEEGDFEALHCQAIYTLLQKT
jgi:hypothetical protein